MQMKGGFKKENFVLLHSGSGYVLPCLQEMRAGTEKPPQVLASLFLSKFFFCPSPHVPLNYIVPALTGALTIKYSMVDYSDHRWLPFSAPSHSRDLPQLLGKGQNSQHASHNLSLPTFPISSPLPNYGVETKIMPPGCFKNHY